MGGDGPGVARRAAALAGLGAIAASTVLAAPRIASLDQCADQYVLALAPRSEIVALSPRARQADSALKARAAGLREARTDLETLLALGPTIVVRAWGGDSALLAALGRRGVRVVSLGDPTTFADIRADIRRAAAALGAGPAGEILIGRMDNLLARAAGSGRGRTALYLSAGGDTAGPDTLMGAVLRAAGYRNAEQRPGYRVAPLEQLVRAPPSRIVAGFFDADPSTDRWAAARHGALAPLLRQRTIVRLPAADLACPSWTFGYAVARLAGAGRVR